MRLNRGQLLRYAVPAVPLAVLGLPLYAYVPALYAEMPSIGFGLAGLLLFVSRLFDLVSDPLMGRLADRLRARVSPPAWMSLGAPLLVAGIWALFDPPSQATVGYLLAALAATYLGWTLISVPYQAWGAELATGDRGRRQVAAWREGAVLVGALLALFAAALAPGGRALIAMAWLVTLLLPMAIVLVWTLPRRAPAGRVEQDGLDARGLTRLARPIWRLVGLHFCNALAAGIPATLFLIFAERQLGLAAVESGWLLLLYFGAGILALPFWLWIATRIGEARAWGLAMLIAALAFVPAAWLGQGDLAGFAVICLLTGATLGADIALPAAILARLANHQSATSRRPREGTVFGLFAMAGKLALAFAVGITLPLLSLFQGADETNPALPWLYGLMPAAIKLALALAVLRLARRGHLDTPHIVPKETDHASTSLVAGHPVAHSVGRL